MQWTTPEGATGAEEATIPVYAQLATAPPAYAPPTYTPPAFPAPSYTPPSSYAAPSYASPSYVPPSYYAAEPPRRSRGPLIAIILLSVALAAVAALLVMYLLELNAATTQIRQQDQQLEEQRDLIDRKETFGAAMGALTDTIGEMAELPFSNLVSYEEYDEIAVTAWEHRWDALALDRDITDANEATEALQDVLAAARSEAESNATGSKYESVIDELGNGHVVTVLAASDYFCQGDVIACVASEEPQTVHFDTGDNDLPYMTDWLRTGIAYHEFAHVLQFTNPEQTEVALEAFGGDPEIMADCYALTYLPGWTLDHRVFVPRYGYVQLSLGYGYNCNEPQREAVRVWVDSLGFTTREISQ